MTKPPMIPPEKKTPPRPCEKRRTLRIKRSGLLSKKLKDIDKVAIKFAETREELQQAFTLVHDVYLKEGYLKKPTKSGMFFSIFSLLPETVIIAAKSYLNVISTLTEIFDTKEFGLPMDSLYKNEVEQLRKQSRKIVELSALATSEKYRWKNLFMYIVKVMYWYSVYRGTTDILITVNPKHVSFYKNIFLFEDFGPERYYPRVGAPAVALRIDMNTIHKKIKKAYNNLDFDCNLYAYFFRMTGKKPEAKLEDINIDLSPSSVHPIKRDASIIRYFLDQEPSLIINLNKAQKKALNTFYPGLNL